MFSLLLLELIRVVVAVLLMYQAVDWPPGKDEDGLILLAASCHVSAFSAVKWYIKMAQVICKVERNNDIRGMMHLILMVTHDTLTHTLSLTRVSHHRRERVCVDGQEVFQRLSPNIDWGLCEEGGELCVDDSPWEVEHHSHSLWEGQHGKERERLNLKKSKV